jgi:iron complex outermembrane recepter protein
MKQTRKRRRLILNSKWLLFFPFFYAMGAESQSLKGHIVDSATHLPVEGAFVYIPQLKVGDVTDKQGFYNLPLVPKGDYEVSVQSLGYATVFRQVGIYGKVVLNVAAVASYSPLNPVMVTSLGNVTNTLLSPVAVTVVTHRMILEGAANTAIDLIASEPGVSETTEGVGTTKPQINGLGFDRVLVLTDGLPQEDFQWGDDHGILIDPYAVFDAEIIRGPASLQYGASAEAGVVNFKSAPFVPSGTTQGSWLSEYHTNNGYIANSLRLGGNHQGFVYDLRASGELAHSYWNPKDGYVWGSAWNQGDARLTLGLEKPWGFSRLTLSTLVRRIQVPDGNRDSATGRFLFDNPVNEKLAPSLSNFLSYNATIAGDKILDEYQAWWQNSVRTGKGSISFDLGFTASVHHDIDSGTAGENNMVVYDLPYSLKYQRTDAAKSLKFTTGVNGTYEFMRNLSPPPAPYVPDYEIPNYRKWEGGGFAILEKDIKEFTLSGGLRYDVTHFTGNPMSLDASGHIVPEGTSGSSVQFTGFDNTYSGWSGSVGATYQLPHDQYIKINLAKSFRAPAINELTSNGLNIGSNAFQLGNNHLEAEQGYQADLAYGYRGKDISIEIDAFYNHISHFIFADRTDSVSQGYPVYEYVSSNTAILTGLTAYVDVHPSGTKWLQWNNRFSYIYTYLPQASDSTAHIPWTPAPHLHSELKFQLNDRSGSLLSGTYLKIGVAHYWEQRDVYSALYTEIPSEAYTLVDAGIGTQFVNRKTGMVICSLFVNGTNLTNIAYADHLNLAQYFYAQNGHLITVTNQRQGVFNMGRDFTLKVVFPFGSHNKIP